MRNNIWDQKKNNVDSYGKIIDILLRKKIYREKLLKERTTQTERSVDQLEKEKKLRTLHKRVTLWTEDRISISVQYQHRNINSFQNGAT